MTLPYGETAARTISAWINGPVADETALALIPSTQIGSGAVIQVGAATWYFDSASSASGVAGSVVVPSDSPSTGRWKPVVPGALTASSASVPGSMSAANFVKLAAIQSFDATLVAGTVTKATGIVVTSTTRVVGINPTVRGGTFPAGGFQSLTAGNVVGGAGTGAVTITARKADGTLENACTDTVSVLLAG